MADELDELAAAAEAKNSQLAARSARERAWSQGMTGAAGVDATFGVADATFGVADGGRRVWIVDDQGQRSGPHSTTQLAGLLAAGRVSPGAMVWREGWGEWAPILSQFRLPPPVRRWRGPARPARWPWVVAVVAVFLVLGAVMPRTETRTSEAPARRRVKPDAVLAAAQRANIMAMAKGGAAARVDLEAGAIWMEPRAWATSTEGERRKCVANIWLYYELAGRTDGTLTVYSAGDGSVLARASEWGVTLK